MCARFSLYATPDQIAKLLEIDVPDVLPHYNIAPTQMLLGAIERNGHRELREFRWGLIPSWAKDASIGNKMINARGEGLLKKPAFRKAFERRRCVLPANGFFEWEHKVIEQPVTPVKDGAPSLFEEFDIERPKTKKKTIKQPYFLALRSGEPFALAGLYEYWTDPSGDKIRSCTIVTTEPNSLIAPLHDRMPVLLRKEELDTWLNCEEVPTAEAARLIRPLPSEEMTAVQVGQLVNNADNDCPEVLERIA